MKISYVAAAIAAGFALWLPATAQQAGEQTPKQFTKQVVKTYSYKYLLYTPADYAKDPAKKWPLILFLHGSGESGSDLNKVKEHGPPMLLSKGKDLPFIVVSPQSPGGGWLPEALNLLLDEVEQNYRVDTERVYLTGLSMGGYGTWALASETPARFAAIAPVCGGGAKRMARRLKDTPVWVFHGAKDDTVPIRESQDMVDALKAAGADVKFTIYPDADHDSWTATYNNPELFTWFLQHKKVQPVPTGK